ncbi:hypothetical protein [Nocardioides hankookensis]|uniref:Uncharacterized protein n=1 Tax=Nocardioides hankookensis TaxID=443157 RepID=A0ABW1LFE9_9ACTN
MLRLLGRALPVASLIIASLTVVGGVSPSTAAASGPGTIVYVKGHDVYVALPDGTGERRLTTNGSAAAPWVSPDGDDNGIVVAARGTVVYRMNQWGQVLNSFDPPDSADTAGDPIGGAITHVAISADGRRVAYTYQHYTCPPLLSCKTRWITAVSAADHLTNPGEFGPTPFDNPTWVSGSRLLVNGRDADGIQAFDLGVRTSSWFNDGDGTGYYTGPVTEPALARTGESFAAVYKSAIVTYAMSGDVRSGTLPDSPSPRCGISSPGDISGPTFAPDGAALAWQEPDGVWTKQAPLDCSVQPELVIPGASQPAWTAAALQRTRPPEPKPIALDLKQKPAIKGTARVGKRLNASSGRWSPAPGKVAYQWLRNGKAIKRATKSSYRPVRTDRGRHVSVRVTVSRSGFARSTAISKAIRIR